LRYSNLGDDDQFDEEDGESSPNVFQREGIRIMSKNPSLDLLITTPID